MVEINPASRHFLSAMSVKNLCDHEECTDRYQVLVMEAMETCRKYEVTGEQFAAIVMDLANAMTQLIMASPRPAHEMGLPEVIGRMTRVAAIAYQDFEEKRNATTDG